MSLIPKSLSSPISTIKSGKTQPQLQCRSRNVFTIKVRSGSDGVNHTSSDGDTLINTSKPIES